jgi:para-nitrobenzyl esterase
MKIQYRIFFLLSLVSFVSLSFSEYYNDNTTVKTEAGLVAGTTSPDGVVQIFKGIPFAAPPVGDLRWRAPQPVKPWKGVRQCTAFGPSPMQASPAPFSMWSEEFLIPKEPISEDCLYLNVWTSATHRNKKKPVLVWIYGGGFVSGGSAVPIYDGEAMARKGIVFVSINYRVGIFGFFAHPELSQESGHNASGNYGIMDQVAALKWVQKNIAAFGGDPSNVTIAGQSAGSMSVNCLVASPLARNLFNKAIAQSGASIVAGGFGGTTLQQAEQEGMRIAQSMQAGSISELRKKPADEVFKKGQGQRGPIIDGYVLPQSVPAIFAARKENSVALLTGWNEDEGLIFGPVKKADAFRKDLEERFTIEATTALKFYPASNDEEAAASQLNLSRDMIFGVQNYAWANVQHSHGSKVFVYRFARKVPATGEYVKYGAFHTGEVPYAYDNLKFVNRPWQQEDHELAGMMSAYWANFVTTGNPNGANLPGWPAYDEKNKMVMVFDTKSAAQPVPGRAGLDFIYHSMMKSK